MGENNAQPTAILGDLFGKNRLNMTTRQVSSPVHNPSESESQVGSVANHKVQNQDEAAKHRKGKMTEELNEQKIETAENEAQHVSFEDI